MALWDSRILDSASTNRADKAGNGSLCIRCRAVYGQGWVSELTVSCAGKVLIPGTAYNIGEPITLRSEEPLDRILMK